MGGHFAVPILLFHCSRDLHQLKKAQPLHRSRPTLNMNYKSTNSGKINRPEKNPLDAKTTYHIGNRSFVVEPVFKKESPDTLGGVLLRLMKSESEKL